MRPFLDSTDIYHDAESLRRRMDSEGYLYIRGLLPKRLLEDVRLVWLERLFDAGCLDESCAIEEGVADPASFRVEPQPHYMRVVVDFYRHARTHEIPHHPALLGLIGRIVEGPVLLHPLFLGRFMFPNQVRYTTPAHQDWVPVQGSENTYTAWIPLMDLPREMGGLAVCAGSHRAGIYDFGPALGSSGIEITDPLPDAWRYNPFEQGDVLIFHSKTAHKGVPLRGRRLRLSLDARYQSVHEPIVPGSLESHGGVAWDEIYAGWEPGAEPRKYYWKQLSLNLVPYDQSYTERRDSLAFEMAEAGDVRAISTLQRIVARDRRPEKIERARKLLEKLEGREFGSE